MFEVTRIRFGKKGVKMLLSPLESDVLSVLWANENGEATVREVHKTLKKRGKRVVLTSIAVMFDRLHQKKLVSRKIESGRGGYHYIYSPRLTKEGFHESIIEGTIDKLIDSFGSVAVNYFNERFAKGKK